METVFSRYLKKLFIQYKNSLGDKNLNIEDPKIKIEFYNWLQEYQVLLEFYRLFLKKYGINNSNNLLVEIGKGTFDTVSDKNNRMLLLTPYVNTFDNSSSRVIHGKIVFDERADYIKLVHSSTCPIITNVSYFLSQNPYNQKEIVSKLLAIYQHEYNVCLGMFGKITDQDREFKMKTLETFQEQVNGKLRTNTNDDNYFGLVYTNTKFKKTF